MSKWYQSNFVKSLLQGVKKVIKNIQVHKVCLQVSTSDKHFFTSLTEEISTWKFCSEVFVNPESFVNKMNILEYLYSVRISILCDCSNNNAELLQCVQNSFYCTFT